MAVRIRLARGGAKKRPFYQIVAAVSTSPRDGRYLEKLGTYNPMLPRGDSARVVVKKERMSYWLDNGAQPTDRVKKLIELERAHNPVASTTDHVAA